VEKTRVSPRDDALIVMARYPRPGAVKTRLAAAIGDDAAAMLYRAFLDDLRARLSDASRWALHWAFAPASSAFAAEFAGDCPAFPQADGDLGARMSAAMRRVLSEGARRVVLIGSDVPHVSAGILDDAFGRLTDRADLVLGPAEDGGYYLIGARTVPPVFDGPHWGGTDVLATTLEAARRAGLETQLVDTLYDIDDVTALARLDADVAAGRVVELPATRAALERLRSVGYI
jgi:uncharacterized protein